MKKSETIIEFLKQKNFSIATAESCTGGYVSYLLTRAPGSSKVFKGGVIVYSLASKNKFFKLSSPLLERTQGVSHKICAALARKVRLLFKSDIGLAIVGFAGPEAGNDFPAGTVFIAISSKHTVTVKKIRIRGNRDRVRKQASERLLAFLTAYITKGD